MNPKIPIGICVIATWTASGHAQSVDPDQRYAWAENVGLLNFADAGDPAGSAAVEVQPEYLQGYIWGENIGWLRVGDGSGPYPNINGADSGVNVDLVSGELTGFAWGENIGWVNFAGGASASPPNPARIEGGRFRGYAWGENIGWINLDDDTVYVGLESCPADLNNDGALDFFDVSVFLSAYNTMNPIADLTGDGVFNFFDVSAFLGLYSAGCP
ncbi:MAG: hypothetical protein KDA29_05855 [Phycisphaerales bacterium]|nr:hypothetical protein [Phycisphaerales bacterium]